MTRDTSVEAYREIKENGLLSKQRWEVYDLLFEYGPRTAAELWQVSPRRHTQDYRPANINRLGELRDCGVVKELEPRKCSVTGRRVIVWDVTRYTPVKPVKKCRESKAVLAEREACAEIAWRHGSGTIAEAIRNRDQGDLFG